MRILLLLLCSIALTSASAQKLTHLKKLDEGKCQIAFPVEPSKQEQEFEGFPTVLFISTYKEIVYLFSYSAIPIDESEITTVLHATKGGFLNSVAMKGSNEKEITKGKIKRIHTNGISVENNLYVTYEVFYHNGILYQIGIMQKDKLPENKLIKAFFKSFKILK
jgi:hypothetical protein